MVRSHIFSRTKKDRKMTSVPLRKKFTNTLISRLFKRDPNQWPNHPRPGILLWACSCPPWVYKYSRAGFQF
ncbi:hypothetical protein B0H17DRAFT_1122454, partial [Mycena rosella]